MDTKLEELEELGAQVKVDRNPLQIPNRHRKIRVATIGGPKTSGDRRMYMKTAMLKQLLAIAEASIAGEVQMDSVGLEVTLYEAPSGHRYEVWKILGGKLSAYTPPALAGLRGV